MTLAEIFADAWPGERRIRAQLVAGEDFIFSGIQALKTLLAPQSELKAQWLFAEGDLILRGQTIVEIKGPFGAFHAVESLVRSAVRQASGLATLVRLYAEKMRGSRTRLLLPAELRTPAKTSARDAFFTGSGAQGIIDDVLEVPATAVAAFGGYSATLAVFKTKASASVFVECRDTAAFSEALQAGFGHFILDPATALAVVAQAAGTQILVRGSLPLETISDFSGMQFHFLQPLQISEGPPQAECLWDLTIEQV